MSDPFFINKKPAYGNFKISIGEAFLFFLIVVILGQLIAGVVTSLALIWPEATPVIMPLSFLLGFGVVAFTLLKIKGLGSKDVSQFLHTHVKPMHVVLAVLLYGVSLPLAEYLSMLVPTHGHPFLEKLYEFFSQSMEIVLQEKVAAFIMVCILAPVLEEFIFRGIILRGLLQKQVNPWVAVILTGFLFGAAHMNPWQFFGAGFLGIIFGLVYWRTQSLWLVIFLHFLNNFIAYIITIYTGTLEETVFEPNTLLITGSVVLTVGLIYFLITKTKQTQLGQPTDS